MTCISMMQRCLMPIFLAYYNDQIWCDIIPTYVSHVLLGRPWLYDVNMIHNAKVNIYVFEFESKKIRLNPRESKELMNMAKCKPLHEPLTPIQAKKPLYILRLDPFLQATQDCLIVYTLVVMRLSSSLILHLLYHMRQSWY